MLAASQHYYDISQFTHTQDDPGQLFQAMYDVTLDEVGLYVFRLEV